MDVLNRAAVIVLALVAASGRLHGRTGLAPDTIMRELAGCLSMVRVAVSRRSAAAPSWPISVRSEVSGGRAHTHHPQPPAS